MAWQDWSLKLTEAVGWRWRTMATRGHERRRQAAGEWVRRVMDRETEAAMRRLPYGEFDALEISGSKWQRFGFKRYRSVGFETFDVCERPLADEAYDVVIIEQVLEHVLWPYRATRHLHRMLRPGGVLVVTTPFLVKIHGCPVDCTRWTELGLKHLLAEGGFPLDGIQTGSWGNVACVRGSLHGVPSYRAWYHTLRNDPLFPMVVWAFARKGTLIGEPGSTVPQSV